MHELDVSSVIQINLPEIPKPHEKKMPDEYWEIYNQAYSYYNRRWYEKAKNEFSKLFKFENPYHKIETLLSPAYRKLTDSNVKKGKIKKAYELYEEFFSICKDEISNRDRTKYNKLVEKLLKKFPDSDYKKVELAEVKPEYEIINFGSSQ